MNNIEKPLTEMLNLYKAESVNPGHVEIEIRFKDITSESFTALYNTLMHDTRFEKPELECSINIISENVFERSTKRKADKTQYIRKIIFDKGAAVSDEYSQKLRLAVPIQSSDYIKYVIGISRELPAKKFPTAVNALVRFKARVSFMYGSKWRFDLTAIKYGALKDMEHNLKTIKNELFTSLTVENFIQELNFDIIDGFEVEIEYVDSAAPTMNDFTIIGTVFSLINPKYLTEIAYQEEIYSVAEYIVENKNIIHLFKNRTHRLKKLGNQVITLNKNTYYSDVYPAEGYCLTDKADGVRCIVSINGNRCRILKSDTMIEYLTGTFIPAEVTIADAELLFSTIAGADSGSDSNAEPNVDSGADHKSEQNNPTIYTLRVFDVMVIAGKNISRAGLETRIQHLADAVEIIRKFVGENKVIVAEYTTLRADNLAAGFTKIWNRKHDYIVDGLILSEPGLSYSGTKNYKWKPYEYNTIDFLAIKCPQKLLGIKPFDVIKDRDLYLLFVGINHTMREKLGLGLVLHYKYMFPQADGQYYPIQFSPSISPFAYLYYHVKTQDIDRQIIELSRDKNNTTWVFHRVRTDRSFEKNYYGNDFRVAELTYTNYIDPFNFEDLWSPSESYFTKKSNDLHLAPNKYKRFVISVLLKNNLAGVKWIIDEAAGRGADLHRYQEIGVENALFIDVDATAVAELIRRKFAYFAAKKRHIKNWFQGGNESNASGLKLIEKYDRVHDIEYSKLVVKDVKSLTVHTLVADLKSPHNELIAATYQYGLNPGITDGIVCNFALHYLCDTLEHLRNLLIFNARMLKVGGLFIFTVMDGKSVFELLKPLNANQQWESREGDILKYAIKKKYSGDKFSGTGQMISVLLPFSDEMYDEPLCNVDLVITEAARLGFEVELNTPMNSMFGEFAKIDRSLHSKLTSGDQFYNGLFRYVSLRLIKEMKCNNKM